MMTTMVLNNAILGQAQPDGLHQVLLAAREAADAGAGRGQVPLLLLLLLYIIIILNDIIIVIIIIYI